MDIPYATRSKFLIPCEQIVTAQHQRLDRGERIDVPLEPGGYNGHLIVTVQPGITSAFQAEWSKDPTRFPSRIKAAATALRNCGITGSFNISHDNGRLFIMRVNKATIAMHPRYLVQRSRFANGMAITPFTYFITNEVEEARQEAGRHLHTYIVDRKTGETVS